MSNYWFTPWDKQITRTYLTMMGVTAMLTCCSAGVMILTQVDVTRSGEALLYVGEFPIDLLPLVFCIPAMWWAFCPTWPIALCVWYYYVRRGYTELKTDFVGVSLFLAGVAGLVKVLLHVFVERA